jgi:hypothetical protein
VGINEKHALRRVSEAGSIPRGDLLDIKSYCSIKQSNIVLQNNTLLISSEFGSIITTKRL